MAGLSDFLGTDSTDTTAPAGGAGKSTATATPPGQPPAEAAPPPTTPTLSNFLQGDSAPDIGGTRTGGDTRAGSLAGSEKNIGTPSVGDMGDFGPESLATAAERGAAGLASLPRTVQDFLTPNPEIAKDVYSRMAPWRRPKEGEQPVIPKWPWTSEDVMNWFTGDLGLPNYQPKTAPGRVFQSGIAGAVGGLPFGPAGIMAGLFGGGAQQTAAEMNLPRPVQVAAGIVAPLLLHAPGAGVRQLTRSLGESGEKSIAIKALDESSDDPNAPINDSPIAGTPRTTGTATGDQGLLSTEKRAFQRSDKAQADFIRIKTAANQAARDHLATVGTIPDAGEATLQLQNEATNMASYVKRGANAAKTAERTAWQQVDPHDQLNVTSQAVRADLDLARRNLGVEREDLVPSYVDDIAGKWGPTVSLNGLKNLSSRLLSDIRGWSSGPSMDLNRAQAAGQVQRVVQRYLDSLAATDPVQQANLDAARTATRNYHTVYDNDITKRVIGQTSSGQDLVDETHVGDKYLASGRPEDLTQYVQATGGTPQAMGAARNWLLAKLFDAGEARAGDSGFLINSRVSQFVRKYQGLLNDTRLFSPAERDAVQRSADQLNFTARTEGAGMRAGSPTYANLASAGNVANTILGPRGMQFARTLTRLGKGIGAAGIARLATNYGINPTEAIAFFLGSEGRTGEGLSNWIAGKAARIQDHIHQALADPEYYEHLRTFRRGPVSRGPQTLGGAGLGTYTSQNPPGAPVPPADPTQQGQARGGRVGLAAGGPLEEGLDTEGEAGFDIPFDIPHAPSIPAYPGAETGELPGRGGVSGGAGELAPSHRPSPGYGGSAPLAGLPARISIPKLGRTIYAGPSERIRQVAGNYMAGVGQPDNPPSEYLRVDPARGARIAQAYHEMQHDPEDPLVKASYRAMAEETLRQYRHIKKAGLKPEFFWGDDPYEASPRLVTEDIANNNHMWVYPTDRGFGTQPITEEDIAKNPMLAMTKEKFNGQPARVNDIFRVVHDYFGHAKEGVGFRADGEENAWNSHARMYSPLARIAMTGETRGQNSWLNWGPHGVENRTAPTEKTVFAEQKQGIMPDWVYHEGAPGLAPIDIADMRRELAGPKQLAAGKGKVTTEKFRQLADINAAALGLPQSKELSKQLGEGKKASEKLPDTGLFDLSLSTLEGGGVGYAEGGEVEGGLGAGESTAEQQGLAMPVVRTPSQTGLTTVPGDGWYRDRTYDVLVNPTKGEVYEQARNAPHNSIRMFRANDGKVYSWNGHDFLHHQMALKLGIQDFGDSTEAILHQGKLVQAYDGRIYRDDDGTLIPMWGQDTWFRKPARGERSIFRPPGKRGGRIGFAAGGGFTAYHGSPHTFDAFDASKIGTGEGAQAYGHGLYFAENPGVATNYRDALTPNSGLKTRVIVGGRPIEEDPAYQALPTQLARARVSNALASGDGPRAWNDYLASRLAADPYAATTNEAGFSKAQLVHEPAVNYISKLDPSSVSLAPHPGSLYKVSIDAEPEHFLDWDKPLSEQHPNVKSALMSKGQESLTGMEAYQRAALTWPGGMPSLSKFLYDQGIPGIRYLDQGSRDPKNIADLRAQIAQMEPWSGNPQFDQGHVQNQLSQLRAELQRAENPTHNYVVFDPSKLSILERNKRGGRIDMQKGGRVK